MYWLTGYETFGFCFFQCLIIEADGEKTLFTRIPDLLQAQATSTIKNVVLWHSREKANPAFDLRNLLNDLGLLGSLIGVEYRANGLDGADSRLLDEQLASFAGVVDGFRLIKSKTEIDYIKKAAKLSDEAFEAALKLVKADANEAEILAVLLNANFLGGGDFPANEYIIGSGSDALLCRYKASRRILDRNDQFTLEWFGVNRHYHAPMMRTIIIDKARPRHLEICRAYKTGRIIFRYI